MSVILITGCSSGFGLLTALHFARKGDTVYASMRNTSKAGELEKACRAEDLKIDVVQLDVTDEESVTRAVKHVMDGAGRIDVLVNNAGLAHLGPMEETEDDELKEIFETNFFGALRVTRAVAPHMRERRSGTIVNVSSMAAVVTAPFRGVYSASKRALEAASEALRYELHPFGVRVLIIEPGGFETKIEDNGRVPRRFTEGSPYVDLEKRFAEALAQIPAASARGDAGPVAELIYNAVQEEQPNVRYRIGQDAEMIAGARQQMDDEQFEQSILQSLGV